MNDRSLIVLRDSVQRTRLVYENILRAMEQKRMDPTYRYIVTKIKNQFDDLEKDMNKAMEDASYDYPIVNRMVKIRGIGKINAMNIVVMIDIRKADTISALWRYAGYAVIDGYREKPVKGEPLHYNTRLKTACYLIGTSFLRSNSPYRRIYDEAREYYDANRPDWTKAHCHAAAMRKMIKVWLAHLWLVWREMEGLPVYEPYIFADNPHHRFITPEEMGW